MTTAIQALWNGKGGFDIRDQDMPEPGRGEVVLRVGAAGICGSDLYYLGIRKVPAWREAAAAAYSMRQVADVAVPWESAA